MPAVIYSRFSPRKDASLSESCECQEELCRKYCAEHGLDVRDAFNDKALSGSEEDRPGLWCAVECCREGDVLVVAKLDRLARDTYLAWIIERDVEKRGARIVSVAGEGTVDDSPESTLVRRILAATAEWERKVIAARTKSSMLRHQAAGRRMSAKCPYGMMRDPVRVNEKGKKVYLMPCPEEAPIVDKIVFFRTILDMSTRKIAKKLELEGYECRGRKTWHWNTIGNVLERKGIKSATRARRPNRP